MKMLKRILAAVAASAVSLCILQRAAQTPNTTLLFSSTPSGQEPVIT